MTTSLLEAEFAAAGVAQVIVVLSAPAAANGAAAAAANAPAPSIAAHFTHSEYSVNSQLAAARVSRGGAKAGVAATRRPAAPPKMRHYRNLGIMLGTVDRAGFTALQNDPNVAAVISAPPLSPIWPDRIAAAKPPKDLTWGLKKLRVDQVWAQNITGAGVRVGHLDTGADGTHPMLSSSAIHKFAEFDLFGTRRTPAPAAHDTDPDGHGTHTAATIAGRRAGNRYVGVAPGAQLLSAIVIEDGNVIARVLGGLDWALGEGMRVLSMSLGFRGWWDDFVPIMAVLRARNVLPVIAVGNEGPGTSRSPGNYPNVLSVGAMDENDTIADFSGSKRFVRTDRADVPYLVAPGVDIVSAMPGNRYQSMDGSSMATPHVAGLAALLFEAKKSATAQEVENAILQSCTLSPSMTAARAGAGCPDAVRALEILTGNTIVVTPSKASATKQRKTARKKQKTSAHRQPAAKKRSARSGTAKRQAAGNVRTTSRHRG